MGYNEAMFPSVDTRQPTEVEIEVQRIFHEMYPTADRYVIHKAFGWITDCFNGKYGNYQPIDALYHDLEHTLQGTLCLVRLLQGRHQAGAKPELNARQFELGLLAILMHDTGYLKTRDDTVGTGAKYTPIHVDRSAEFAAVFLREKGYAEPEIRAVQNMIHCTGVNVNLAAIPFAEEWERTLGFALGSADLLGQMAADDYVDKLPILYEEFEEAARFNKGTGTLVGNFASALDLMEKTPLFWEKYVLVKLERDFKGLYHFLRRPYPDGPNPYIQRIEANLQKLRERLEKLRREAGK